MSYTRIDDGILTHPKMAEAEELCPLYAWALWTKALVFVNQHKLDGRVTMKIVARLIGAKHAAAAIKALVSSGLWDEEPEGWRFHDFEEHNLTKDARSDKAKKNAENQAAHRERQRLEREAQIAREADASKRTVSAYGHESKQAVSDNESAGKQALFPRAPACARTPLLSTPLPSPPVSLPSTPPAAEAEREPEDPSEDDMFKAYTAAANGASALAMRYVRDDRNIQALSTVWGTFGYKLGQTPAEFLANLGDRVREYIADCQARKQPPQFEVQYAPYRFLAWLNATAAGLDPLPRSPCGPDGKPRQGGKAANGGGMSSPYSDPTPEDIARMTGRAS